MRRKIVFEQGVAFLPGAKANGIILYTKTDDAASTKQVVPKDLTAFPWSWWGSDNLFHRKSWQTLKIIPLLCGPWKNARRSNYGRVFLLIAKGRMNLGTIARSRSQTSRL